MNQILHKAQVHKPHPQVHHMIFLLAGQPRRHVSCDAQRDLLPLLWITVTCGDLSKFPSSWQSCMEHSYIHASIHVPLCCYHQIQIKIQKCFLQQNLPLVILHIQNIIIFFWKKKVTVGIKNI